MKAGMNFRPVGAGLDRQWSGAFDECDDIAIVTDSEQRIVYVNGAFERATGYTRDEVLGRTPGLLDSGQHGRRYFASIRRALARGQVWSGAFVNRRKDGGLLRVAALIVAIRDGHGNLHRYVSIQRDSAREEDRDAHALLAQRLEIMGLVSGGIAHDLNNVLQAIAGYSELMMAGLDPGARQAGYLAAIGEASRQARDLVAQMLDASRQPPPTQDSVVLPRIMEQAVRLARPLLGRGVEVRLDAAPDVQPARADAGQLNTLLLNLLINAAHAMPDGGMLSLDARNVFALDAKDHFGNPFSGAFVRLRVCDTGLGMTADVLERIFEPFFTTKQREQGTGLGLFMARRIIERHGGHVQVGSAPGSGTTFDVYLPPAPEGNG